MDGLFDDLLELDPDEYDEDSYGNIYPRYRPTRLEHLDHWADQGYV